jgi:hypothetical protein
MYLIYEVYHVPLYRINPHLSLLYIYLHPLRCPHSIPNCIGLRPPPSSGQDEKKNLFSGRLSASRIKNIKSAMISDSFSVLTFLQ